jgi:hypothetical protein
VNILNISRPEADISQHTTCFGYLSRNIAASELIYTSGAENEKYGFVAEEFEQPQARKQTTYIIPSLCDFEPTSR